MTAWQCCSLFIAAHQCIPSGIFCAQGLLILFKPKERSWERYHDVWRHVSCRINHLWWHKKRQEQHSKGHEVGFIWNNNRNGFIGLFFEAFLARLIHYYHPCNLWKDFGTGIPQQALKPSNYCGWWLAGRHPKISLVNMYCVPNCCHWCFSEWLL